MLKDYKLITPDMVAFEDTLTRCEDWITKQQAFEERYLLTDRADFALKNPGEKIEFRQIQLLVNEYSSLPLLNTQF
jgi:hypothetical protein